MIVTIVVVILILDMIDMIDMIYIVIIITISIKIILLIVTIFRCLKLDRTDPLEFSLEVSDRVCAIIRKIFFTLHIYLSTDRNDENEKENNGKKENKNENVDENEDEEKISHTTVKKIMLQKAVQGVRYILSQDKNTLNNNHDNNLSSSLSLINSFICYLPPNQIDEILKKRNTEKTNLADISSNLVLDSTKVDVILCDGSVLEKCIDFALSIYNSDTNIHLNNNNKFNDNNCINSRNNNKNNKSNNTIYDKNDNSDQSMALTINQNNITKLIEEKKLNSELKLKTEAAMMLALLANKVVSTF